MKRPSVSAPFTATGWCLCLLTASALLMSCASSNPRVIEQTPPRVGCEAGPAALIPPIPTDPAEEAVWIRQVLGLYEGEVEKRAAVRGCLADLRARGVIQ